MDRIGLTAFAVSILSTIGSYFRPFLTTRSLINNSPFRTMSTIGSFAVVTRARSYMVVPNIQVIAMAAFARISFGFLTLFQLGLIVRCENLSSFGMTSCHFRGKDNWQLCVAWHIVHACTFSLVLKYNKIFTHGLTNPWHIFFLLIDLLSMNRGST